MADAGSGFVDILPRTDSFVGNLTSQVSGALNQVTQNTQGQVSGLTRGIQTAFIALGAVAVGAITKGISATTEWAGDVRSLQRVTGQTAESASALAGAGALLGLSVDQLNVGFGLLAKNVVNGSANLTKYGIATKDASGETLPFDEVLGNISDKFVSLPEGMERAAFAQNVFGRSGKALIPILSQGRDGLAALEAKAKDLHLVMSEQNLEDARKLSAAQRELGLAFKGASIEIGKEFIPAATAVVHAFTTMVGVIADIPAPLKVAVLGFTVLTGAVAAVTKVAGFFSDTWGGVLGVVSDSAQIDSAAQSASDLGDVASQTLQEVANLSNIVVATRGSALVAAAPVGELAVAMTTEADAALAASLANTQFSRSATGLIVPTTTATGALTAQTAATTAAGAASGAAVGRVGLLSRALSALGKVSLVAGAGLALPFAGGLFIGSQSELPVKDDLEKIDDLLGTLQRGVQDAGGSMRKLGAEQKAFLKGQTTFAVGALGANAQAFQLALREGISYADALALITARLSSADSASRQLSTGIRQILGGIEDTATPIKDVGFLIETLGQAAGKATDGFQQLSQRSGQDFNAIGEAITQALTDPKTTVEQLPGIFAGALAAVKSTMRDWHAAVVEAFGGAQGAISEFLGQAAGRGPDRVSFRDLTTSLHETRGELKRWSADFDTILGESGKKAQRFLQDMSANGLESIGILDAVAGQPKKIRDQFLAQYNEVNKATGDIASQITDAFGKATDRIVLQLKNIVRAIQGLPPIRPQVDNTQALSAFQEIINKAREAGFGSSGKLNVSGFRQKGSNDEALGGVIHGATGFITQGPVFQIGEGSGQTFAGKGAEAVIPFNDRGIGILAEALRRANGDMRLHITVGFDGSGNLQVRRIARDEIDRENVYRQRVHA